MLILSTRASSEIAPTPSLQQGMAEANRHQSYDFSWGGRGRWFFPAELAELAGAELKSEDTAATWTKASTGNGAGRAEF